MSDLPPKGAVVRLADLAADRPHDRILEPDAAERAALAEALGVDALRKLRFTVRLAPEGQHDWVLSGTLGATVVQPCSITLAPLTTRIDEPVARRYLAALPDLPTGEEVEMPEDDTVEALPEAIDLSAVMREALALAIPAFPRAEGAELGAQVFTAPGAEPLTEDKVKPFADLASLRDKLSDPDGS